ncbi:hypothetical protein EDD85DRAFT_164903 [Armillaria nabsnona]|nr:hypothetical protein EDD85DRAFT_164903 [Armillaria nabsnona]
MSLPFTILLILPSSTRPLAIWLASLSPFLHEYMLFFNVQSVGTRTKTLCSAVFVCRNVEDLKIEGEADEECWCSFVLDFNAFESWPCVHRGLYK